MADQKDNSCCCASLPNLAVIPMGGDGLDEHVFATLETVCNHGGDQWWLYMSRCSACAQSWMVAQEERIFDDYFLHRLDSSEAECIVAGRWPDEFLTYERVLRIGRARSTPCRFLDPLAASLVWTVEDLRKTRPDITLDEIAWLLGVSDSNAKRLLEAATG